LVFYFLKNGTKYAKITVSPGAAVALSTHFTLPNKLTYKIFWGIYDPIGGTMLSCWTNPKNNICYYDDAISLSIDQNWKPENYNLPACGYNGSPMYRKIPNGQIYVWGAPPLPCPYVEIIYL